MRLNIEDYVSKCIVCQKVKSKRGKAQPLTISDATWQSIAMESIQGNNGIWTMVDRFNKQAHFLPVKENIKAKSKATLFISQV